MAVRMVALNQLKNGQFLSRKVIPVDVRDAYARLFGVRREAQLRQSADTPRQAAKTRHAEWTAEIETRIATLRAEARGEGQPLTKLNAIALAGRWYNWFVGQYEDDPGPQRRWREMGDPEVRPTHAWRHTFKQTAERVGISETVHDEITGHEQASEGRKYSVPTVEDMAAALKKFPRYEVERLPIGGRGKAKNGAQSSTSRKSTSNGNRVSRRTGSENRPSRISR
jgi:hypothetical protein